MKKTIALLTAFVLLTSIFQFSGIVFAEEKAAITLEQAIKIAKDALGINTEGFDFNSSYYENQNGYNVWNLNWNKSKTNNEYVSVSVDSDTGLITSAGWWSSSEQPKSRIPKHSKAEALKAAQELAAKLQGDKFKQTKLSEGNNNIYDKYSDTYSFTFTRTYDGISIPSDSIMVQLYKDTLKLSNFSVNWGKGSLPSKAKAYDLNKAKQLYKEKLGLELTYNLIYGDKENKPGVMLAYTPKYENLPIDAITGELLRSYIYMPYNEKAMGAGEANKDSSVITPEEQAELEKSSKYITKAEAEQAVKQYIPIDSKLKLERANLYAGYNNQNAAWNLEWRYIGSKDNTYKYLNVQVDAVTKEIMHFDVSDSSFYQNKDKTGITEADAKKLAEDFLKKIQPEKFAKVQYKEYKNQYDYIPVNDVQYKFNFLRVENGIPCPSNSMFVGVNKATGEIVSYNLSWLDLSFPAADKVISLDQAYDVLFSSVKYEMQYIYHYKNANDYENRELRLAYVLENVPVLIDAGKGIMLDYNGKPVTPAEKYEYNDIQGSKAEEEINLLVEMGILVPDSSKYMPDAKIQQKDFIKLLISSIEPQYSIGPVVKDDSQYNNYYNEAVRRKIITEADRKPEAYITRQDAAKMIIRAMGYGVIAEKSGMFAASFKDAAKLTEAYKGYAVMAAELGIIPTADSAFNPAGEITKGDTAEFIVNYLRCETSL